MSAIKYQEHILIPQGFEFPKCDHPIEKWCKNCDFDYETYDRIPHFRKYSSLTFFDDKGNVIE